MRELSLHVLDVLQNAVEAGARRIALKVVEDLEADRLAIEIADDGRGMDREMVDKVLDPFVTTRTTRHVGLGLPLFAAAARRCEGDLTIQSEPGRGTCVKAWFRHSHWDRAPLGDMPATLLAVVLSEGEIELEYNHQVSGRIFRFDTKELRKELNGVPLNQPKVSAWIQEYLVDGEKELVG